jgi:hypothetical protein
MPTDHLTHAAVRLILLADWDPVGVSGLLAAENEYDALVTDIVRVAKTGSERQLAQHLHEIETKTMGLAGDMERCLATAQRLHALRSSRRPREHS